jgi:hypothetical protein
MTWDALRQLREGGEKPSLPVIVTTKRELPRRLDGVGCLTVLHEAGTPFPVELLDGIDVIFFFDKCELAGQVQRLAKSKGVKFGWARAWCTCGSFLTVAPLACDSYAAAVDWMEGLA